MALRDQPYLPLYIQDIMTDEKLNECSAATQGIYIKGIMCLMHKSETYGKLLLKQKFKQNSSKEFGFALMLAKHLPYTVDELHTAITELINERVCFFDGDFIVQKRMVRDNEISEKRSLSGKKGGEVTTENNKNFAQAKVQAKVQANTEYENEYENSKGKEGLEEKPLEEKFLVPEMLAVFCASNKNYLQDRDRDYPELLRIANFFKVNDIGFDALMQQWKKICDFIASHSFYRNYSLLQVNKHIQAINNEILNGSDQKNNSNNKSGYNGKSAGAIKIANSLADSLGITGTTG